MILTLTALLIDMIAIPAFWISSVRLQAYSILALLNAVCYVAMMIVFFIRTKKAAERHGFALRFVLIQLFMLASLFLFKMTELLLRHAIA